jgi:ribosomal protein S12 methylthiotransferase accessory factor
VFLKPRFRASFDVHTVGATLFLLDEHHRFILEGASYCLLAPLLNGAHTIADIERQCRGTLTLPQIFLLLHQLEQRGFLVEGDATPANGEQAFWEYYRPGVAPLPESRPVVAIRTVGQTSAQPVREAMAANDIAINATEHRLLVVVTDDYLRPELETINREALQENRPWMLIKPVGMILWIGPLFQPHDTGCWHCLRQRLQANRQTEKYIQDHRQPPGLVVTARAALPTTLALGCNLAATVVAEWFRSPSTARLRGKMLSFDLALRGVREHVLVRRPQCPACGDPTLMGHDLTQPVTLHSHKKRFWEEGGHRTLTPQETFERYKHHVSPFIGAVTDLIPAVGHWSELTPSFVAGHNFSMGVDSLVFLRESVRGVSGGKGVTPIQAKVSALCEALERYSALYCGDEDTRRGTYSDMQPHAIHPNDCMGFSPEQFERRQEWNTTRAMGSRCELVPNPFDTHREIDWSPLWSLTDAEYRYLPTAYCYYGHPEFTNGRWCHPDSNGTAAGNTREEAILQGFMELVERDAVALWWYNRLKRRAVNIDSFQLPYLSALQEYYADLQRELWVLDITSDLNIATFACISQRRDRPVEDIILGFGAHFDPNIALLRAVTEVNQFLPSVSMSNPDGSTRYLFGDALARHWWTTATIGANDYLLPDPAQPPAQRSDFANPSSDDLLRDVQTCIEICRQQRLDLLFLDQTRPDIGLSVVKVVVPQLCHFWRRLGKPRLYHVPVAMGWRERPLPAEQLNPYSIFF